MYNEQQKMQFIREKKQNASIAQNLENCFKEAEPREERYGRDISEWSTAEIIDFYKWKSTPYIQSLVALNNSLEIYTNWCILNGLVADNQNHFHELKSVSLCKCIDFEKLKRLVIKRDELLEEIHHLDNAQDQFIFLGIFEGIPVADNVLYNVKLSDLNGDVLKLSNGNSLKVSKELVHIMNLADEETTYMLLGRGKALVEVPTISRKEIIRPADRKRKNDINPVIYIGGRIRKLSSELGLSDNITIKTISESGRIYFIRELMEKYHITAKDAISEYKSLHENIYGKLQNVSTYIETYGKIIGEL